MYTASTITLPVFRQLAFFLLLGLCGPLWAQRVAVSGTVAVAGSPLGGARVVVNDTINKFLQSPAQRAKPDYLRYQKLFEDARYSSAVTADGRFRVLARPTDSLFFERAHAVRQAYRVAELLQRPAINIVLQPEPCLTYVPCRDTLPRYFVFIGEKISVEPARQPYYCNRISMDSKYQARYKVLRNTYGQLPRDTVQFVAYDHYGRPAFSKYQTVLLFVSEYCQELIHQKYQYYPLYQTADNQWAAPYAAPDYASLPATSIKPHLLKFREPVVVDITNTDPQWVARTFPAPYYRIENNRAIAEYGNYVSELLELKKQTVLKARGVVLK